MISREASSLLLKANRVLGTRLVEAELTNSAEMDRANELFIERARAKDLRRASLLRILIFENQSLQEDALLDYQLENFPVGAVQLENIETDPELILQQPYELLRASWTVPLDCVQGRWFLASAYYLSEPARTFWEERLDGRINWYLSTLGPFEALFEELQPLYAEREAASTEPS